MKLPRRARSARRRALTMLPAVALAAAMLAVTPATAHAATTSGWNDDNCKPSAEHPRPVVLIHGTFGNGTDNWLALAPYLVARGYCVFSFDYGQLPGVPFFDGLGPVTDSAQQLADEVDHVLAVTGADKVDLVGHSQGGGLLPRYYLKFLGGAAKVNDLIGLAPDNHGTTLDGLVNLLHYFPGAAKALNGVLPQGLTDQEVGSAVLTKLNADGDTVPGVHYTVISTRYDEVVTPYTSQALSGPDVHNVVLQGLCLFDISEHVTIGLADRIAYHEVANALDPAQATTTNCASAF